MPAWSRFILTVFVPHWLDELEDEQRREREAAAKRKSFNSTKAHGNGGSSNARDGNACSSSREGNGGSSAAGDDAVADNLAPVMPTVKRRRTSRDKQSSNISTVSNEESYFESESRHSCDVSESVDVEAGSEAGSSRLQSCLELNVEVVVGGSERESEEEMEMEIERASNSGLPTPSECPRDRIVAVAGVGLVVAEADEGKKEEVGEGVGVGEEDEGKKEEEVEEEEEDDDGLKGARAVEGAMKKRKRAITDTSASVKAAKRVRMRHDILCGVCNKRVKIQSFPRHKRVHDTQTTYVCTYANCPATYSRKDSLASHVKQRHS